LQQAHGATTVQETEGFGLKARIVMWETDLEDGLRSVSKFDGRHPGDGAAMIECGADAKAPLLL
jgi:hypothetical protein